MNPRRLYTAARAAVIAGLIWLIAGSGLFVLEYPQAIASSMSIQQATEEAYPAPGENAATETLSPGDAYPGSQQPGPSSTPRPVISTSTPTQVVTATQQPNIFLTEDAEMGGSRVTPPAGSSPAPTITFVTISTLPAATQMPQAEPETGQGGFQVDWGLFWIGFAIPVLAASGLVLYLLDRRPELFTRRSRQ